LYIEGRKVYGHKLLTEPVRCMKCQGIGLNHVAATCKSICDVCARCGGVHRTADCTAPDDKRACANCKIAKRPYEGHGAADRSCPAFQDKLQFALERNPEAKYPFFMITEDPSTWVTHDEQAQALLARANPEWRRAGQTRDTGKSRTGPGSRGAASERARMTQTRGPDWVPNENWRQPTLVEMANKAAGVFMHPDRMAQMPGETHSPNRDPDPGERSSSAPAPTITKAAAARKAHAHEAATHWPTYKPSWDDDVRVAEGETPAAGSSGALPPLREEEEVEVDLPLELVTDLFNSPATVDGADA
jgi:hypothetical protein